MLFLVVAVIEPETDFGDKGEEEEKKKKNEGIVFTSGYVLDLVK